MSRNAYWRRPPERLRSQTLGRRNQHKSMMMWPICHRHGHHELAKPKPLLLPLNPPLQLSQNFCTRKIDRHLLHRVSSSVRNLRNEGIPTLPCALFSWPRESVHNVQNLWHPCHRQIDCGHRKEWKPSKKHECAKRMGSFGEHNPTLTWHKARTYSNSGSLLLQWPRKGNEGDDTRVWVYGWRCAGTVGRGWGGSPCPCHCAAGNSWRARARHTLRGPLALLASFFLLTLCFWT